MTRNFATAIHEAGHVIGAHVCGHPIERVTLKGAVVLHPRDAAGARAAALVGLCGPMAELRYLGGLSADDEAALWTGGAWSTDLRHVLNFLDRCGGGPCAPVRREAELIVRRHWDQITKVAAALAKRGELSGAEVQRVIGRAGP